MTMTIDIQVPDIGDVTDVSIVDIPVSVGDLVAEDDPILALESDKATLDVPAPRAGRIAEILVAEGDRVSRGSLVMRLAAEAEAEADDPTGDPDPAQADAAPSSPLAPAAPDPAPVPSHATPAAANGTAAVPPIVTPPGKLVHASPSIRKYARTLGASIAEVAGTGPKGRITREDVEAHVKARLTAPAPATGGAALAGLPDWPKVDFASFGPVERQRLGRIGRLSGPALARNALVIPHVCNFDRADVTDTEDFRRLLNAEAGEGAAKLTLLSFAVKAVVAALKAHPRFNSSLDGEEVVLKHYWNIGVAADTPEGLVVPVIHEADCKSLREIAAEMAGKAAAARAGKLRPADMQGASFTISSLGGIGGTGFTPIINAPEVAILGMTRAEIQPVWDGTEFRPRLMQPLCLSWDHRVVDGVAAARFLGDLTRFLGDFRRISV